MKKKVVISQYKKSEYCEIDFRSLGHVFFKSVKLYFSRCLIYWHIETVSIYCCKFIKSMTVGI